VRPAPRRAVHAALTAAVVALAACAPTSEGPGAGGEAAPEPGDVVVKLVGLEFEPRSTSAPIGRRVVWQWTDSVVHNVVSRDFASSKALNGGSYAVRFDRAGTFPYRCTLHTGMDGTVVVTP